MSEKRGNPFFHAPRKNIAAYIIFSHASQERGLAHEKRICERS